MRLAGILNLTPDSFFDGGKYNRFDSALARAATLAEEGADLFDIGGQSTRPGSLPVSAEVELERILPVITEAARRFPKIPISVDTQKSSVALAALDAGAQIINDISALRSDEKMAGLANRCNATVVLMHMQGTPQTMQKNPNYEDVVNDVQSFLSERIGFALRSGIPREKIWIDPGIGFGKTSEHNLEILRQISKFQSLGCGIFLGVSRKSFLGKSLPPEERLEGSLACAAWAYLQGVSILRVHDVGETKKLIRTLAALAKPSLLAAVLS